jgi:hypothetical protein
MSDNAGLFGGILIILVSIFFMLKSNPQRIFIHDDLSISNNNIYVEHVDTVITDVSRWFYTQRNDRKMRNITISVYKEPSQGKPYEFYELSPDDYADISLRISIY